MVSVPAIVRSVYAKDAWPVASVTAAPSRPALGPLLTLNFTGTFATGVEKLSTSTFIVCGTPTVPVVVVCDRATRLTPGGEPGDVPTGPMPSTGSNDASENS